MPTFGSLFAGIGGLDLGLERAGFECKWQVEFDPTCQQVLANHWPNVKRYGDVTKVKGKDLGHVDLIVGGWPCQDLSVAGQRAGLAGQRSGLFFEFMRLVDELSPEWLLAENVPGLLSAGCKPKCEGGCVPTHGGAMGTVVGALANRGYGFAWRVLDAQYIGLAQRRKRVFIVGHLGTPWSAPAQVLFEQESLRGDPPTRSQARTEPAEGTESSVGSDDQVIAPEVAGTLGGGSGNRGWTDDFDRSGAFIGYPNPARALLAPNRGQRYDLESETLAFSMYPLTGALDLSAHAIDVAPALTATAEAKKSDRGTRIVQSFAENQRAELRTSDVSLQLTTGGGKPGQGYAAVHTKEPDEPVGQVRRLTPKECERLQGFPDDWTLHGKVKIIANSKRYKMLGNAVAVNCSEWIGRRLLSVMTQVKEDFGETTASHVHGV